MQQSLIEVVGGGAIGGTVAACLHRSGLPVRIVDSDARHVAAIRADGLQVTGLGDPIVEPVPAFLPQDAPNGPVRSVYLCTKVRDSESAMAFVAQRLASDGYVLSLQNGLHHDQLARAVGPRRVVPALVNFFADMVAPGIIRYGGSGTIAVGESDGRMSERLACIRDALSSVGPVVVTDNILGYAWSKMAYGIVLVATALTDATMEECVLSPYQGILLRLAVEVLTVARAHGVRPVGFDGWDPDAALTASAGADVARLMEGMAAFLRAHDKVHSGVWRDIVVRRRATEVRAQFEPVVAMGVRADVPTPALACLIGMITDLEEGRRERGWANLAELSALQPA